MNLLIAELSNINTVRTKVIVETVENWCCKSRSTLVYDMVLLQPSVLPFDHGLYIHCWVYYCSCSKSIISVASTSSHAHTCKGVGLHLDGRSYMFLLEGKNSPYNIGANLVTLFYLPESETN